MSLWPFAAPTIALIALEVNVALAREKGDAEALEKATAALDEARAHYRQMFPEPADG